jgi:hypothetical protein
MSWVSTTPGSDSAAVMRASIGLLRGAPGGIRVIKNMTNSPWWKRMQRNIVVDRRQPCAAVSAALNVLLGRITAVVISLSGA